MKQLNEVQLDLLITTVEELKRQYTGFAAVVLLSAVAGAGKVAESQMEILNSSLEVLKSQKAENNARSERSMAVIKLSEVKVDDWVPFGKRCVAFGHVRVYYTTREEMDTGNGFDFCAVSSQEHTGERMDGETMVEIMFYGNAYFDGVRHLHCGHEDSDNVGYFNYPVIEDVVAAVEMLKDLQTQFCRDYNE